MLPLVSSITTAVNGRFSLWNTTMRLGLVVVEYLEICLRQVRDEPILRIEHRCEERHDLRTGSERGLLGRHRRADRQCECQHGAGGQVIRRKAKQQAA